jgi:putative ABC transport system permease protein
VVTFEVFRVALRALRTNALRTFLNVLGIIIAVTTMIAVISLITGLNKYAADLIGQLGPNTLIFAKIGLVTSREEFIEAVRRKDYDEADVEAVRRLVPEAARVTGRVFATHPVYAEGRRLADTIVLGSGSEFPWMVGLELQDGRYFTESEDHAARPVAVIGAEVVDEVFPQVDPIGRMIKVEGRPYRVIGTLVRQGDAFGQSQDNVVAIPLTAYRRQFGKHSSVDIFVEAPDTASRPAIEDAVRAVLRARRGTPFRAEDPFGVVTEESLQTLWQSITVLAFALVTIVSSLSLVVGGVAIANTMFATVMERTREIGIRKAMGARRRDLLLQFLVESVTLTFLGGLAGVLFGWMAGLLIGKFSPFPALVTGQLVGSGLAVATVAGLLAGWLPAWRAAGMDPVEALRSE